ncbi:DHS-like NAD/FAD-binding domain-containing protein [Cladochytrium replicatum]|nr:DHS-like NAD/FAD-binding domain-containing protein [Cladochytrium replicatum]
MDTTHNPNQNRKRRRGASADLNGAANNDLSTSFVNSSDYEEDRKRLREDAYPELEDTVVEEITAAQKFDPSGSDDSGEEESESDEDDDVDISGFDHTKNSGMRGILRGGREVPANLVMPEPTLSKERRLKMLDSAVYLGFWGFVSKYQDCPLSVLLEVFLDPEEMAMTHGLGEEEMISLLKTLVALKAGKRPKLTHFNTYSDVLQLLQKSKNILVLTGAGVSVSCGIPDFRSQNGIYAKLGDRFDLDDPQQMFDIEFFRDQPEIFYSFAREIYPSNFKPSPSHYFIKLLEQKGKLLRNYTQNIDTLEQSAEIEKVLNCHGSFASAACIQCGHKAPGHHIKDDIFAQRVPRCPKCKNESGVMKPDIVFFGEKLCDSVERAFAVDREKVDLLVVIGSSLKVSPVAEMKDRIPRHVPQVLINLEVLKNMSGFDVVLCGYCDTIVEQLCRDLQWELPSSSKEEARPATSSNGPIEPASKEYIHVPPNKYFFDGAKHLAASESVQNAVL